MEATSLSTKTIPHPEWVEWIDNISRLLGMDLHRYHASSLLPRLLSRAQKEGVSTVEGLVDKALHDPACLMRLRSSLTLGVTALFRDASFFQAVRLLLPSLASYARPKIWVAGCSTGEEVLSYRILLTEAGLADRTTLYATDIDAGALDRARAGTLLSDGQVATCEHSHRMAGGRQPLRGYMERTEDGWRFKSGLLEGVVWGLHNLLTDASLNEFHFISCRNVMMYLNRIGQRHVMDLLHDSLCPLGYVGLGMGESLVHAHHRSSYRPLFAGRPLYRRVA